MPIRIGLMGFGRIGRNLFRSLLDRDDIQIAAISDTADHHGLAYLLQYDTILGRLPDTVRYHDGAIHTHGQAVPMLSEANPGSIDWQVYGVDVVVEAAGRSRTRAEAFEHVQSGAKCVILCAPPTDPPDLTVVMGINHHQLKPQHKVISNSSITTHCAAPLVRILNEAFGIEHLFFTSLHAYTNDLRLADVPAADLRCSRAAAENIIPTRLQAVGQLEYLFPDLRQSISGLSLNVPVPNGSLIDLVVVTRKPTSPRAANEVIQSAVQAHYTDIVEYAQDPIVSSDVKSNAHSCVFDSLATMALNPHMLKAIAWCDNGWGYVHRVADLISYMAHRGLLK